METLNAGFEDRKDTLFLGKRTEGGVEAARKLRKELVRLFAFAKKAGMRPDNPVQVADRVKVSASERTGGRYSWSKEDIAKYRARHALGTRARLAMKLLLWTGQRRSDGVWLGPADNVNGRVEMSHSKTGKALGLRVAPLLTTAIDAMPPMAPGQTTYLVTGFGKPYSKAGFGNAFRDWCDEAGLPQCTAHGLRKAMMRRMSEIQDQPAGNKGRVRPQRRSGGRALCRRGEPADDGRRCDYVSFRSGIVLPSWRTVSNRATTDGFITTILVDGDPYGNRTRASAVKGPRPNR